MDKQLYYYNLDTYKCNISSLQSSCSFEMQINDKYNRNNINNAVLRIVGPIDRIIKP